MLRWAWACTRTSILLSSKMTRIAKTFLPNPKTHEIYDQLYNRVYLQMYSRLKPLYEEIRSITGYPSRA